MGLEKPVFVGFVRRVFFAVADLLNLEVDLFDTTSTHFEIEDEDSSDEVGGEAAPLRPLRTAARTNPGRDRAGGDPHRDSGQGVVVAGQHRRPTRVLPCRSRERLSSPATRRGKPVARHQFAAVRCRSNARWAWALEPHPMTVIRRARRARPQVASGREWTVVPVRDARRR